MREKDELDSLLDAALVTYADPGPDSGLEQRILARISAENFAASAPAPRRRWLPWGIALAGACLPAPLRRDFSAETNSSANTQCAISTIVQRTSRSDYSTWSDAHCLSLRHSTMEPTGPWPKYTARQWKSRTVCATAQA